MGARHGGWHLGGNRWLRLAGCRVLFALLSQSILPSMVVLGSLGGGCSSYVLAQPCRAPAKALPPGSISAGGGGRTESMAITTNVTTGVLTQGPSSRIQGSPSCQPRDSWLSAIKSISVSRMMALQLTSVQNPNVHQPFTKGLKPDARTNPPLHYQNFTRRRHLRLH